MLLDEKRTRPLVLLLAVGISPAATAATAAAQQVTVSGVVVEASQSSWIGGATVQLSGSEPYFTDLDGRFRFTGVTPGRHTLSVEAYGYRPWSTELVIRADTTLQVEMEPDPVVLDSIVVAAEDVTIQGTILDAATHQPVLWAEVTVYPGGRTTGALSGGFTLRGVPGGRATTVVVEALEYVPARIALITEADTALTVELDRDPVAVRMIAQQVERLESRSGSVPIAATSIGRDEMAHLGAWTVADLVRPRLPPRSLDTRTRLPTTPCLFIDDQHAYAEELQTLFAGQVQRIEIFGRGRMIRIYTTRYAASLMGEKMLPEIIYNESGLGGPVCY